MHSIYSTVEMAGLFRVPLEKNILFFIRTIAILWEFYEVRNNNVQIFVWITALVLKGPLT